MSVSPIEVPRDDTSPLSRRHGWGVLSNDCPLLPYKHHTL